MSTVAVPPQQSPGRARRPQLGGLNAAFAGSGARWLLAPPLLFVALMLVVPLGFVVATAFQHVNGKSGLSQTLSDPLFRASLWRTFVLAAIVCLFTLVLGTLYALAMAVSPRWLAIVLLIALFTIFWTSLLVRTYGWILLYLPKGPLYSILHGLGLTNSPLNIFQTNFASYPAMVHVMMPYVVLPVFTATRQIDPMQIRAARVCGARPLLILRKIILPALRSGIAAGAVLVFVQSLGFYVTPTLLGSQSSLLVSTLIGNDFQAPGQAPVASAMSLVLLAVVVVVYIGADRVFRVSETWGARS